MDKELEMTSSRPYLIRAVYDWITDNALTPYILVNAENDQAIVPQEHINNGKIVLNVSPNAVRNLDLGNDMLQFDASFQGRYMAVAAPIDAVLAIYAKENGRGMVFSDDGETPTTPPTTPEPSPSRAKKPSLRVVK